MLDEELPSHTFVGTIEYGLLWPLKVREIERNTFPVCYTVVSNEWKTISSIDKKFYLPRI